MAATTTTNAPTLKELYPDDVVKELTYQDRPLLEWVPKSENFGGKRKIVPVVFANPQGRSKTFGDAVDNKGSNKQDEFIVTRVRDYSLVSIANELIEASEQEGDHAFVDALDLEVRLGIASLADALHTSLFRNLGGALGQVGSISGSTITLKDPDDVVNFEVGMEIETAETDGTSGSVQTSTATITAMDRDAGTITSDSGWVAQISALDADDYLFVEGDFGLSMSGLASWLPVTAPASGDSFFGMDRSQDATRLGGVRVQSSEVSGMLMEEKIQLGISRLRRQGGRPDTCVVSEQTFHELEISLSSKSQYNATPAGGDVGFKSVNIHFPGTSVNVMPDFKCPNNRIYLLQKDSWDLSSIGPAPHILDRDRPLIRESSSDAYEARIAFYGQLCCNAPGRNAVIDNS